MAIDKINPAIAANVYSTAQKNNAGGIAAQGGGNFGDLVKTAAQDAIDTMHHGEKVSADAIIGKANLTDVVAATTEAELTLNTIVALRDQMISAYQKIMQTQI